MVSKLNSDRKAGEGAGQAIGRIYGKIGFGGLWNGLPVRIFMIGTLTAFQWLIYDSFKVYLGVSYIQFRWPPFNTDIIIASNHRRPLRCLPIKPLTSYEGKMITGPTDRSDAERSLRARTDADIPDGLAPSKSVSRKGTCQISYKGKAFWSMARIQVFRFEHQLLLIPNPLVILHPLPIPYDSNISLFLSTVSKFVPGP